MKTRQPLDVAEFGRRVALFQGRVPSPPKVRSALEAALLELFQTLDGAQPGAVFEPGEAELLQTALQAWRRPGETPSRTAFFQRVFDAVPTPAAVFGDEGIVWNRSLAACLTATEGATTPEEQRAYLARMAPTVRGAGELRAPELYYALGRRLYRLAVCSLPELRCSAVYFFPDGRALPDVEPAAKQLLAYRLSGLSLKQIAPLLGLSYSRVEGISKRSRRHLMRLRSESCPETAG